MNGLVFNPEVTISGILIFVSNIGLGLVYILRMEGKLNLFGIRLNAVERAIENMTKIDSRLATIEERLTNHVTMLTTCQRDISDLRRGVGWIQHTSRQKVDGEY